MNMVKELIKLKEMVWLEDIESPTVPEYVEHHESITRIKKAIDKIIDRAMYGEPEPAETQSGGEEQ